MRTLWPAYVWPGDDTEWHRALAGLRPGDIAVANPDNGPGWSATTGWTERISQLRNRGVRVAGYVALGYGAKTREVVLEEMTRWRQHYGQVDGFFFDEAPTAPATYLRGIHAQARGADKTGLSIWNPGVTSPGLYVAMIQRPGSVWITWEGSAGDYIAQRPRPLFLASRQAHLVYACPADLLPYVRDLAATSGAGWGYVTSDTLPNPWDTYQP